MSRYSIMVLLDLGDLGQVGAQVEGFVNEAGLFGAGSGYMETEIEKVTAHIHLAPENLNHIDLDVTRILSKAARASICEQLQSFHESQRQGA